MTTMKVSPDTVKELRQKTGAGVMDCRRALAEASGDMELAIKVLRQRGLAIAEKKASRKAEEGLVGSYIHLGGKIGVLVEVNCETDFVARTEEFKNLARDLAMHIAWADPGCITREKVDGRAIEERKALASAGLSDKPREEIERVIAESLEKFYKETCLMEQPFVKNPDISVGQHVKEHIARIGENIQVKRFARFQVGEARTGEAG